MAQKTILVEKHTFVIISLHVINYIVFLYVNTSFQVNLCTYVFESTYMEIYMYVYTYVQCNLGHV